jgi:ArsR family transcriptional regulator, arsenate/arsenite/antimonite-responsive transcriptional repressor / arsenate reductase (thioredoxin)
MVSSVRVTEPPALLRLTAHPLRWRLLTALAGGDYRVRELTASVDRPQNLVSYHLRLLRDAGLVTSTRSSFDGRDSYYHLDLDRCAEMLGDCGVDLHPALRRADVPPIALGRGRRLPGVAVLFVCTGNSTRSPMAEALLRHHARDRITVTSAGTMPKSGLDPNTVRVLRSSYGIDVAERRPRHLDTVIDRAFSHVITLCDRAREVCPEFANHPRRSHWSVPDPAADGRDDTASRAAFARAAADINTRIRYLLPVLTATD